jgi:hypothetical protein
MVRRVVIGDGHVSIEPLTSIVRYHPDGKGYGSPYVFSCVLTRIGDEGWLNLATGHFSPEIFRAVKKALLESGLESVDFERKKRGRQQMRHLSK